MTGARKNVMTQTALIVGTGSGISASVARLLSREGYKLALASRKPDHFAELAEKTKAHAFAVDAASPAAVAAMFSDLDRSFGRIDVVVYNASFRTRGPLVDLVPGDVMKALEVTAFGGFLVAQQAARRMLPHRAGTILFTGASASMKGYAQSAPFAMGKFALRGLAQAMARELQPKGIHVAHFNIDGGVRNAERGRNEGATDTPDSLLDPDAVAETYLAVIRQPRSAWSTEVELRPWVENF
jgi:NAD(P)-dependent dehydrogenase (short-subunit alcohol dehydrogenase family)